MNFGYIYQWFNGKKINLNDKKHNMSSNQRILLSSSSSSLQQSTTPATSYQPNDKNIKSIKYNKHSNNCYYSHVIIYFLLITIFICLFGLSLYFSYQINKATDVSIFKKYFKSDCTKEEIKNIITNIIKENNNGLFLTSTSRTFSREHNIRNERKLDKNNIRIKRDMNIFDDNIVSPGEASGPEVEFFNPKLRHELEKKDAEAPGGDSWVWLTSYSRIPYDAITGFCRATKEYCPLGPPGIPGLPGPRGNTGLTGLPGIQGIQGAQGLRGLKGEPGLPGMTGFDGRDGIPGEPGLDGVPGRAGNDGKDGKNGENGKNGEDGKDGKDGVQGPKGNTGEQGHPGPRGQTGPRGKSGKNGMNGTPGLPGINAWKVKLANGTYSSDLLIPPNIIGADTPETSRQIIVHEGDNLRLRCAATGIPTPTIQWRREDGKAVPFGLYKDSSMIGHTLNMTKINRIHMGGYQCIANNGIAPSSNQTFNIEVHFAPLITVKNPNMYVTNGSVTLECDVEMFPEAIKYWEKGNGRLLEPSDKYRMENNTDGYKTIMRLNITKLNIYDHGVYFCIAKNELGKQKAEFTINARGIYVPQEPNEPIFYGNKAPEIIPYEKLCPDKICTECAEVRCREAFSVFDLIGVEFKIETLNKSLEGLKNRNADCIMYAVGKPVYHNSINEAYQTAWLKDGWPRNDDFAEKIWIINETQPQYLYEYSNKSEYRANHVFKIHKLQKEFRGNANIIFNGSFYYNQLDSPKITRFDLNSNSSKDLVLPGLKYDSNFLYKTNYNYVDFSSDENGLWVVYSTEKSNNTMVARLDHRNSFSILHLWNITVNHHKVGEMFVVCGVLYAIDSANERNTKIRLAVDLFGGFLVENINIPFTNPFRKTTTVGYNPRNRELYTIDKGNLLTYPIRTHDSGNHNNVTSSEKIEDFPNAQLNGYDISQDNSAE